MVLEYTEELTAISHRHPAVITLRTGVDGDGKLCAMQVRAVFSGGVTRRSRPTPRSRSGTAARRELLSNSGDPGRNPVCLHESGPLHADAHAGQPADHLRRRIAHGYYRARLGTDPVAFRMKNLIDDGEATPHGWIELFRQRYFLDPLSQRSARDRHGVAWRLVDGLDRHPACRVIGRFSAGAAADGGALQPGSANVLTTGPVADRRHDCAGLLDQAAPAYTLSGGICAADERGVLHPLLHRPVRVVPLAVSGADSCTARLSFAQYSAPRLVAGECGNCAAVPAVGAEPDRFDPTHGSAQSQWRCGVGVTGHVELVAVRPGPANYSLASGGRKFTSCCAEIRTTSAGSVKLCNWLNSASSFCIGDTQNSARAGLSDLLK